MKNIIERAKKQVKAAAYRAFRAGVYTFTAALGGKALLSDVDWAVLATATLSAMVVAFLHGIACKLPECHDDLAGEFAKGCGACGKDGE
ncbi:MAG: hypothetical protein FWB93_03150 [Oscillospiraceae bacterium]|nr:hypothetical protein [Oscillospiraceae bacterium]